MPLPFSDQLGTFIESDQLEEAITLLQDDKQWIPDEAREEIMQISTQLRQLRQLEIRRHLSEEEISLALNKIKNRLITLNEKYSTSAKERFKRMVFRRILWMVLLLVLLAILIFLSDFIWT